MAIATSMCKHKHSKFHISDRLLYPLLIFLFLGAHLEIVTDKSQEGAQFCKGFGGIGGP